MATVRDIRQRLRTAAGAKLSIVPHAMFGVSSDVCAICRYVAAMRATPIAVSSRKIRVVLDGSTR